MPRPTRLRGRRLPGGGCSSCRCIGSGLLGGGGAGAGRTRRQQRDTGGGVGGDAVDTDQVAHLEDHAAKRRRVGVLDRLVQAPQPQRGDGRLLVALVADGALAVGDSERVRPGRCRAPGGGRAHAGTGSAVGDAAPVPIICSARRRPTMSSGRLPRSPATSCRERRLASAETVARTTLIGLLVPSDLVRMSWMPAASTTARIAPPEMTPVPGTAGLSSTLAAPSLKRMSWGMVVPTSGTVIMCFLASSTPLRIASGTSPALPSPAPTRPCPSPTTTIALKLNRRPPLTTLATRLIWTTRSSSASLFGSILATGAPSDQKSGPASRAASASDLIRPWYRNPARSKTTCSTPAVLARSATSRPTTAASSVFVCLEPRSSFSTVEAAASVRPEASSMTCA